MEASTQQEFIDCVQDFDRFCSVAFPGLFIDAKDVDTVKETDNSHIFKTSSDPTATSDAILLWALWKSMFRIDHSMAIIYPTKRQESVAADWLSDMVDTMPDWLKPEWSGSSRQKRFADTDSKLILATPAPCKGCRLDLLVLDGVDAFKDLKRYWMAACPLISQGGKVLFVNHNPEWQLSEHMSICPEAPLAFR